MHLKKGTVLHERFMTGYVAQSVRYHNTLLCQLRQPHIQTSYRVRCARLELELNSATSDHSVSLHRLLFSKHESEKLRKIGTLISICNSAPYAKFTQHLGVSP